MDHKTGQLVASFWRDSVLDYHNDFEDNNDELLTVVNNMDDDDLPSLIAMEDIILVDLTDTDSLTIDTLKRKVMTMIKIRRQMKENMIVSGTHSHRPLDFLDVAIINNTKGGQMLNRLGVYYFYVRSEEQSEAFDAAFQPFLDDSLKGSTVATAYDSESYKKRKLFYDNNDAAADKAISTIINLSQDSKEIISEMKRSNDEMKRSNNIEIAKALGDMDLLNKSLLHKE